RSRLGGWGYGSRRCSECKEAANKLRGFLASGLTPRGPACINTQFERTGRGGMTGTIINVITVLVGTALGVLLGGRLSERMSQTVLHGLGLVTAAIGLQMFLETANVLIGRGATGVGGSDGEWWSLAARLNGIGAWLEARVNRGGGDAERATRFIRGFVTASLLFCVGPMAILGSTQDGLTGDYRLL